MSAAICATVAALVESADRAGQQTKQWIESQRYRPSKEYELVADSHTHVDEERFVPPVDGSGSMKRPEPTLVALGWRFNAVPVYRPNVEKGPKLNWQCRTWLAVPPEQWGIAARHFAKKADALAWALTLPDE